MKNNKGKKIKIVSLFIMLLTVLCIGTSMVASAQQTSSLNIRNYQINSYTTESEKRTATNVNNAWKILMTETGEKQGTITTFWLAEKTSHSQLSKGVDVGLSKEYTYTSAYSSASGKTVVIGAENNTWNSENYDITFKWAAQSE